MDTVAARTAEDRADLFRVTADRMDFHPVNVEKDFWVCWLLKQLFSIPELEGWLTFKGGTSLSKCFSLIQRFSEDIDLAVDFERLGFTGERDPRRADLSYARRQPLLDEMLEACRGLIAGPFKDALAARITDILGRNGWKLEISPDDANTVEFEYPRRAHRLRRGLQGGPVEPVAAGLRQADQSVRRAQRQLRPGDAAVQHDHVHGPADAEHPAVVRPVRTQIIGERIRDKKQATASQGKYVGGGPILGLDVVDKKYVVNREEAKLVRDIFDRFEKLESCRKVAVALNAEGLRTKVRPTTRSGKQRGGKPWRQRSVYEVLINRKYIGQIAHKGKAYPGEHKAIVPTEQFERVQKQLSANKTFTHKHQVRRFVLLRRMIRCGHCGGRVQPTWTRKDGREYRYYACTKKVKEGYGQCPLPNLPAGEIETAVVDQLRALLRHPDVIARTYREISKAGGVGPDPATLAKLDELRMRRG